MKRKVFLGIAAALLVLGISAKFIIKSIVKKNKKEEPVIEVVKIDAYLKSEEFCYLENEYNPKNVTIYAVYNNDSKKDVTQESKFECDSSKIGKTKCNVYYMNFHTSYNVTIKEAPLVSITLDTSNVKKDFLLGETFNCDNLIINGQYDDNKIKQIDGNFEYTISLNGKEKELIDEVGIYKCEVKYRDFSNFYEFSVSEIKNPSLFDHIDINIDELKKEYLDCSFNIDNLIVKGITPNGLIKTINSSDYRIDLYYNNHVISDFSNPGTYLVRVLYTGPISCINSTYTYEVLYVTSLKYVDFMIDTTDVKKNFISESFDYSGLKVYAVANDSNQYDIPLNMVLVKLYFGDNLVSNFSENGVYQVRVSYNGEVLHDVKVLTYDVDYTYIENVNNNYSSITTDYADNPLSVLNLEFNDLDLPVYAITIDNRKILLDSSSYELELYKDNSNVSGFRGDGTYELVITYIGQISCINKKTSVTIYYSVYNNSDTIERIEIDYPQLSNTYIAKQIDLSQIKVKAISYNGLEKDITEDSIIELYYNDAKVDRFILDGLYEIRINYNGSMSCTTPSIKYQLRYQASPDLPDKFEFLSLDYQNCKDLYFDDEVLDTSNLKVYGVYDDYYFPIDQSDFDTKLYFKNELVSSFSRIGRYMIKVNYHGSIESILEPNLTYWVSYDKTNEVHLFFEYEASDNVNEPGFDMDVNLSIVNPKDLIIVPSGYIFIGYKEAYDFENLKNEDVIIMKLQRKVGNMYTLVILNEDYTYKYNLLFENENDINIDNLEKPQDEGRINERFFDSYELFKETDDGYVKYVVPKYNYYSKTVNANYEVIDDGIKLNIEYFGDGSEYESFIYLYTKNNEKIKITSLDQVININPDEIYDIKGYYKTLYEGLESYVLVITE